MPRNTRNNPNMGSASQDSNILDFGQELQKLEMSMKQNASELRNLILTNNAKNVCNDGQVDSKNDLLDQIATFERNTQDAINGLRSELSKLKHQTAMCEKKIDDLRQFDLLNGLVISGIDESNDNKLCEVIADTLNSKMKNISINPDEINYCFRLGKKEERRSTKPRPVSVMFTNRWKRDKIFNSKKCLKGDSVFISEWLTSAKLELYKKTCVKCGVKSTWTWNGNIFAIVDNVKRKIVSENDLNTSSK